MPSPQSCQCGSKLQPSPLFDGHGIFMCYACDKCKAKKIKGFRPDIFERYQTDEQIEDDY